MVVISLVGALTNAIYPVCSQVQRLLAAGPITWPYQPLSVSSDAPTLCRHTWAAYKGKPLEWAGTLVCTLLLCSVAALLTPPASLPSFFLTHCAGHCRLFARRGPVHCCSHTALAGGLMDLHCAAVCVCVCARECMLAGSGWLLCGASRDSDL